MPCHRTHPPELALDRLDLGLGPRVRGDVRGDCDEGAGGPAGTGPRRLRCRSCRTILIPGGRDGGSADAVSRAHARAAAVHADRELPDLAPDLDAGFDRGAEVEADQHARLGVLQLGLRERVQQRSRAWRRRRRRDHAEAEGVRPGEPAQDLRGRGAEQAVRRRVVGQRRRRAQRQPGRIGLVRGLPSVSALRIAVTGRQNAKWRFWYQPTMNPSAIAMLSSACSRAVRCRS